MPDDLPDYAISARRLWTESNAKYTDARARDSWAREDIKWGVFDNLEADVRILPDMNGLDVIELGCGTAYFGAWLKKAGARRVVGIDITPAQLDTARRVNEETGLGLEFIEANAEEVPLPDASFDIAFSEYGASIWCDPDRWIPEAARLLRPGGELIFMRNSDIQLVCSPDAERISEQLQRPLRGMKRLDWHEAGEVSSEFHLNHSDMFGLLKRTGFEVIDFRELYAPDDAVDHPFYEYVPAEWAKKWPAEEIWRARKR
ncbi:MAG TPA: class I SAM-dependent methyltransferase [Candidatus Dormibacteraeota bacterium]|nr:class I SAM-dependent methyltransferase [Candidatus Dormibacteraeota bacterium]